MLRVVRRYCSAVIGEQEGNLQGPFLGGVSRMFRGAERRAQPTDEAQRPSIWRVWGEPTESGRPEWAPIRQAQQFNCYFSSAGTQRNPMITVGW
jgi:hypothetical protein